MFLTKKRRKGISIFCQVDQINCKQFRFNQWKIYSL